MDKKQLLIHLLAIMDDVKPNGKHKHHKKSDAGEGRVSGENQNTCEKDKKDDLRMPPSARNLLLILLEYKNFNQRTLAKHMNITAQGVSEVVRKLEQKELIFRERGEVYNENIIFLTERGKEIAERLDVQATLHSENLFRDFTEEDLMKFDELLMKIAKVDENRA